ncbi:hypothetical protein LJR045_000955 [Microbacterium sp. LjRoot45]|uniref:ParB/RepB/Spo0J family partition protein n=1 Tax=Microbacterium sp. LjRoot45 TaxID=3342329 RepID=UPI003ED1002C
MATTYDPTTADAGTVQKIDRAKIIIDPNVRKDIRLDKSFVSSVRVRGFEQLPTGYLDDDGTAHVTIGQRRISAALEIGWPVIPMIIKPKLEAEADRAEELRLLAQIAENEQRVGFTDAERAAGYKQLALLGVTEDQIARKTNAPKQHVQTALKVAASKIASAEMTEHELTLDQAATLVEFENDEQALADLRETAKTRPAQLEHVAQQHRDRVARLRDGQSKADKARNDGWDVVYREDRYSFGLPAGLHRLDGMWRQGDKKQTRITPETATDIPGRVAFIDTMSAGTEARVTWCVRDPKKKGLTSWSLENSGGGKGPLTDEEKAARAAKRQAKAEMTSATTVRRAWLSDTFLPGKHKLEDVGTWIVKAMVEHTDALRYDQARDDTAKDLVCELLGFERVDSMYSGPALAAIEKQLATASTADELRILLAFAIAKVEYPAGNPKHPRFGQHEALGPYFAQLAAWGYGLSDIEQRLVDAHKKGGKR